MAETAALLADEVFPDVPLRRRVRSSPFPPRSLFTAQPQAMCEVPGILCRPISTHLIHKTRCSLKDGAAGAVTLIQRFGNALNLNIRSYFLFLHGVLTSGDCLHDRGVDVLSWGLDGKAAGGVNVSWICTFEAMTLLRSAD